MSQIPSLEKKTSEQDNRVSGACDANNGPVGRTEQEGSCTTHGDRCPNFWHRASTFECCLMVGNAILVLIVVILLILYTSSNRGSDSQVCLVPSCIMAASTILSSIDHEAEPCEDFYQFACGNWVKENPPPEEESSWNGFNVLDMRNKAVIKEALEDTTIELESQAEKNARAYYMSCMDKDESIENIGAKPLLELINRAGGWNISGDFNVSAWDLQTSIESLNNEIRSQEFFSWHITEDDENSSYQILHLQETELTLKSQDRYANRSHYNTVMNAYLEYMTQVGILLGGEEKETRKQMLDVRKFIRKLIQIMENVDILNEKMTLDELGEIAPVLNWQRMFAAAFRLVYRNISGSHEIIVVFPDYLRKLSDLLSEYSSTDNGKRLLSNYIGWRVAERFVSFLPKAFREARDNFRKTLLDVGQPEERWLECVSDTNMEMKMAVGAIFVKKAFRKETKILAKQVLDEVREAFKTNLKHLAWLDEETRQLARDKANAMTELIGFPDYILDPEKLDKEYEGLAIAEGKYLENKLRLEKFFHLRNLKELDQIVDRSRWDESPAEVGVFYDVGMNQIIFPAGSIQPPFYHNGYPMSYNFGSLGVVMGHELIHGFDNKGRHYDKHGNLKQWWKKLAIKKFKRQAKCYVHQYSAYEPIKGRHINGKETLSENIADNGGVKAAYHAYQNWRKRHPRDPILPGLNMTSSQLFFLGFAQAWCSHISHGKLIDQLLTDDHSPNKYRVIGSLANSIEFAREFECPVGSPMNPKKKCEIW